MTVVVVDDSGAVDVVLPSVSPGRVVLVDLSFPGWVVVGAGELVDGRGAVGGRVDAGVARSRSEALSWAVKLVGEHTESWLADLRTAMQEVDKLRAQGPGL